MTDQLKIDPRNVVDAGTKILDQSVILRAGWQDASSTILSVPVNAAGNVKEGEALVQAHESCAEAATSAFEAFSDILEFASEALQSTAFDLSKVDEETARELKRK